MSVSRSVLVVLALAAVVGCKEQLTTPGRCPALCPSSKLQLADTLLTTADVSDTSVRGYVLVREASYLLTSNLDSLKSVALMRFAPLVDSAWYPSSSDTARVGKRDSVQLTLQFLQRDTSVKQLRLVVYRLPAKFDTAATYASIQPFFADSDLVDTIAISDTAMAGSHTFTITDSLLIPPGDSGVVSLGLALLAAGKTALTFGSGNLSSSGPTLSEFVHARAPVDSLSKTFSVLPSVALFVMSPPPGQPPAGQLAIGGIPTARATVRLSLPKVVVDSNAVVRATLLLNTVSAAGGFAGDSFYVIAQPVVRDFGIKSVLWPDSSVSGTVLIHEGQTGPVELDVAPILRFWGTTVGDSTPRLLVIRVFPEGSILGSVTMAGRAAGAAGPQLRVTYVKPYTFGVP
jgi:hypothetical protein